MYFFQPYQRNNNNKKEKKEEEETTTTIGSVSFLLDQDGVCIIKLGFLFGIT